MQVTPIDENLKVKVCGRYVPHSAVQAAVDAIWFEASKRNPNLFDGTVLAVKDFSTKIINCNRLSYSVFYAAQQDADLRTKLNLNVLGVSGISWFGDKVLIGRRAGSVSQGKHRYELVPSGSLTCAEGDYEIDYRAHLLQELEEESGIRRSETSSCEPFLLAMDDETAIYDICCSVQVAAENLPADCTEEYDELTLLRHADLNLLYKASRPNWVATSLAILDRLAEPIADQ